MRKLTGRFIVGFFLALCLALAACGQENEKPADKVAKPPPAGEAKKPAAGATTELQAPLSREELEARFGRLPFEVLDISEQNFRNAPALGITLSSPLDAKSDFQPYFKVFNEKKEAVDGRWIASDNGLHLYFRNIEPRKKYQILVNELLTDALGRQLKSGTSRQETVMTRDLEALVTFASSGMVLPADLGKGLPVDAVNVDAVDIDFHRVPAEKLPAFLKRYEWGNYPLWQLNEHSGYEDYEGEDSSVKQILSPFFNLAYTGRFQLKTEKNARIRNFLPVNDIAELRKPGLYLAVMKSAGRYPYDYQTTAFFISDLGLHVRLYAQTIDAHLSSLASGKPVAGVSVQFLAEDGKLEGEAKTDAQGIASMPRPKKDPAVVLAQLGDQVALVDLRQPALDLSEFKQGERRGYPQELFLYGPRDIYRPGETLEVAGLLRDPDGRGVEAVPLTAEFQKPDKSRLGQFVWSGDDKGYYHHTWPIPKDAPLGSWFLRVTSPDGEVREYKFRVDDFLPERLRLDLAAPAGQPAIIAAAAPLALSVQGNYLYGAAAGGNRLSLQLNVQPDRTPFAEALPGFEFGNIKETMKFEFKPEEAALDQKGHLEWSTPSRWFSVQSPALVRVEASLFDDGGRPVNRMFLQKVWPREAELGLRPASFAKDQRVPANGHAEFEVVRANRTGDLVAGEAEAKLVAENRNYYWTNGDRGWELGFTTKEYTVYSEPVQMVAGQKSRVRVPVEWGYYRLEVRDNATGGVASYRFQAGEDYWYDETKPEARAAPRPDQVRLELNQATFREGETVKVRITPPFDAEVLLSVEADRRLWSQRFAVESGGREVEVKLLPEWRRHDLYVTALALRPAARGQAPGPNRALGLLHLPLERSERHLAVSLDAPIRTRPSQPYTAKVKVEGVASGKKAYVTLAAVDEGVLVLTRFKTPDAFSWFFAPRRFHPDLKDLYHRIIENGEGEWGKLRFGGDEPLNLAGKQPDEDVEILSRFMGPVEVNEAGEAEVRFDLPDFNGAMRLMALAFTDDSYGAADQEVTIAAPLVAEVTMPRFLAGGDRSRLTLALQNLTEAPQELAVELTATSPLTLAAKLRTVSLAAGEKQVYAYPVEAGTMFAKANIDLTVRGLILPGEAAPSPYTRHWTMPVRPAFPAETRRGYAKVESGGVFKSDPKLRDGLDPASVRSRLTVSGTPPLNLAQHLHELMQYPYGCLEQTASTAFSLVLAAPDTMQALGLGAETLAEDERAKRIRGALDRISGMQKYNGGFTLWDSSGPEEHWLTAYVADFLVTARDAGFEVNKGLLEKTVERLSAYTRAEGAMVEERWSNEPAHYTLAYKAYAGYVLARLNKARLSDLRTLFDLHRIEAKNPLPLIHLGIALRLQGDNQKGEQAIRHGLSMKPEWGRHPYYGDYGTAVRDEAMVLALLSREGALPADGLDRLFTLAAELDRSAYLSTQERNALFFLGVALKSADTKEWQAVVRTAGDPKDITARRWSKVFTALEAGAGVEFRLASGGPVYVQYEVNGYPSALPKPVKDDRLLIERTLRNTAGERITANRFRAGDLVLVDLAIYNRYTRLPDLLVVDLLAAGFEIENQNLENAVKVENLTVEGRPMEEYLREAQVRYQEYRADRFVAALDLDQHRAGARHLFYLMRAVTPGRYRIPQPSCEDMYRPNLRATGDSVEWVEILGRDEAPEQKEEVASPATLVENDREALVRQVFEAARRDDQAALISLKALVKDVGRPAHGDRKEARKLNTEGLDLLKSGNTAAAILRFDSARSKDPADVEVANNLGFAYLLGRNWTEAEKAVRAALAIQPDRSAAWANLGEAKGGSGHIEDAAAAFRAALFFTNNQTTTRSYLQGVRDKDATPAATKAAVDMVLTPADGDEGEDAEPDGSMPEGEGE